MYKGNRGATPVYRNIYYKWQQRPQELKSKNKNYLGSFQPGTVTLFVNNTAVYSQRPMVHCACPCSHWLATHTRRSEYNEGASHPNRRRLLIHSPSTQWNRKWKQTLYNNNRWLNVSSNFKKFVWWGCVPDAMVGVSCILLLLLKHIFSIIFSVMPTWGKKFSHAPPPVSWLFQAETEQSTTRRRQRQR